MMVSDSNYLVIITFGYKVSSPRISSFSGDQFWNVLKFDTKWVSIFWCSGYEIIVQDWIIYRHRFFFFAIFPVFIVIVLFFSLFFAIFHVLSDPWPHRIVWGKLTIPFRQCVAHSRLEVVGNGYLPAGVPIHAVAEVVHRRPTKEHWCPYQHGSSGLDIVSASVD